MPKQSSFNSIIIVSTRNHFILEENRLYELCAHARARAEQYECKYVRIVLSFVGSGGTAKKERKEKKGRSDRARILIYIGWRKEGTMRV